MFYLCDMRLRYVQGRDSGYIGRRMLSLGMPRVWRKNKEEIYGCNVGRHAVAGRGCRRRSWMKEADLLCNPPEVKTWKEKKKI